MLFFLGGFTFLLTSLNNNNSPFCIVTILFSVMLIFILSAETAEKTDYIKSTNIHQAIVICEINDGLAHLNQTKVVCKNGAIFNTKKLVTVEKQ